MERELDDLRAAGADVIAIGPGGTRAAELTARALGLSYPVFGDPDGVVYPRFGFGRALMGAIQQSGTVVIGRDGAVRLTHRTANPAAALPLDDVKRAIA